MNTLSNSVLAEVSVLPDPAAIQLQRSRQRLTLIKNWLAY